MSAVGGTVPSWPSESEDEMERGTPDAELAPR